MHLVHIIKSPTYCLTSMVEKWVGIHQCWMDGSVYLIHMSTSRGPYRLCQQWERHMTPNICFSAVGSNRPFIEPLISWHLYQLAYHTNSHTKFSRNYNRQFILIRSFEREYSKTLNLYANNLAFKIALNYPFFTYICSYLSIVWPFYGFPLGVGLTWVLLDLHYPHKGQC